MGEGEEVFPNEGAIERFRSRIKEMNHAKNRKKRYQRRILACGNGGRPRSLWLVKHDDSSTSQRSYQSCVLVLVRFVYNGE